MIIIIYAMPGSQFTFKVLAALQARQIPHFVEFVPVHTEQRRKVLPSGGTMVPEMKVIMTNNKQGNEDIDSVNNNAIIVTDSEAILHWIDKNYLDYQQADKDNNEINTTPNNYTSSLMLYPNQLASDLSVRASTKVLAGAVWYYNWVNKEGYEASMQKSIATMLVPKSVQQIVGKSSALLFLQNWMVDWFVAHQRTKHAHLAMQAMGIQDETALKDEQHIYNTLIQELQYFQSFLTKPAQGQSCLLADSKEPTAADFSVYAQLERLVGAGTASDVTVLPALQQLKDNKDDVNSQKLERLWEWHDGMRERFPVQFKGKRVPPDENK